VDVAGLKGLRVGDAMISLEHGNFVVNLGAATAGDVVRLLDRVRSAIAVPLEVEWRRWGFADGDPAAPGHAPASG
jgi:UDP-N-acetylmuramate dehydrogenase